MLALGSFCVSSANGEDFAKELWVSLIKLELLSASPRRSDGKPVVKSLNSRREGPMSILVSLVSAPDVDALLVRSLFRMTERIACVPQAFWMVCAAKKRSCSSTVSVS